MNRAISVAASLAVLATPPACAAQQIVKPVTRVQAPHLLWGMATHNEFGYGSLPRHAYVFTAAPNIAGSLPERPVRVIASPGIQDARIKSSSAGTVTVAFTYRGNPMPRSVDSQTLLLKSRAGKTIGCLVFRSVVFAKKPSHKS